MNATYAAALIRGFILALCGGGSAYFGALPALAIDNALTSQDWLLAAIPAGAAFFAILAVRAGGEGTIDNHNVLQKQTDNAKFRGIDPPVVIREDSVTPVTEQAAAIAERSEPPGG